MAFGFWEAILSHLIRQVGLRTDAANATGSLHAKVAEELARTGAINPTSGGTDTLFKYNRKIWEDMTRWKSLSPRLAYASTNSTSYSNVVNISGSGYLIGLFSRSHSDAVTGIYEIVLNGVTLITDTTILSGDIDTSAAGRAQKGVHVTVPFLHRFNSSMLVRHKVSTGTIFSWVSYVLD